MKAYVRWFDEDDGSGSQSAPERIVRAAWLVCDSSAALGERQQVDTQQVLAYLGRRPVVTPHLQEELAALYPDVEFDWEALRAAIAGETGRTNVHALTDDQVATRLPELARERELSTMDLSLRLGYRDRQVLPELLQLLADETRVARFERTSGSVFDYLVERHPEYAYLVLKARLFFEGADVALASLIAAEPAGFSDAAFRARKAFWTARLEDHRRRRRPPEEQLDLGRLGY